MAEHQSSLLCKNKELEIDPTLPFEKDVLDRKESIEKLTTLIESTQQPFVLSVEAPWGWGKTTFIRMWRDHLKKKEHVCLHFSAWESDFVDDPLVAFLGEMQKVMDEEIKVLRGKTGVKKQWDKLKRIGVGMLQAAGPIMVNVTTQGIVGKEDLQKITEAIAEGVKDSSGLDQTLKKEQLEKYESQKKSIGAFRSNLNKLAEEVIGNGGKKSPLVFFVDELDRCRPDFAIALLERIKHLFSVEQVVFVLAIDRKQLNESVRALYGTGSDSDGYLRRFIDWAYTLPEPNHEGFAKLLFSRFSLSECFSRISPQAVDLFLTGFSAFARGFTLSLRAQEQCFTQMNIVFRMIPNAVNLPDAVSFLVCLHAYDSSVFQKLRSGRLKIVDVVMDLNHVPESWLRQIAEAVLVSGFLDDLAKEDKIRTLRAISKQKDANGAHAHRVLEALNLLANNWVGNSITLILSQIELVEQARITPRLRT